MLACAHRMLNFASEAQMNPPAEKPDMSDPYVSRAV